MERYQFRKDHLIGGQLQTELAALPVVDVEREADGVTVTVVFERPLSKDEHDLAKQVIADHVPEADPLDGFEKAKAKEAVENTDPMMRLLLAALKVIYKSAVEDRVAFNQLATEVNRRGILGKKIALQPIRTWKEVMGAVLAEIEDHDAEPSIPESEPEPDMPGPLEM